MKLSLRRTLVRSVILLSNTKTTETQGQGVARCIAVSLCLCGLKNAHDCSERTRVRRNTR